MKGIYRFIEDGKVLAESENVLTTEGKALILRYLAGEIPDWAGAVAIGTGTTAATNADRKLVFEAERAAVNLKASKVSAGGVVVRAALDTDYACKIQEVAIISSLVNPANPGSGLVLARFDSEIEDITGGVDDLVNFRVSDKSISLVAGTGGAEVSYPVFVADFDNYQQHDTFSLAYFITDIRTATIRVDFMQDDTNYFRHSFAPGSTLGYKVTDWTKSAMVATGAPDWEQITQLRVTAISSSTTTNVILDALRVNDVDVYTDYGLVSRSVPAAAIDKVEGKELEVEYEITVL